MIVVTCAMVCIINSRLKSDPLRLDNLDTLIVSAMIGDNSVVDYYDTIADDYYDYCDYVAGCDEGSCCSHHHQHHFDYDDLNDDCHTLKTIETSTAVCAWKPLQTIEMNSVDSDSATVTSVRDDGIDSEAAVTKTVESHRSHLDYKTNYYCSVTCYSHGDGHPHRQTKTVFKSISVHDLKTTVKNHFRCLRLPRTTETIIATTVINDANDFHRGDVFDY